MIYQWCVKALVNDGIPCEITVLGRNEEQAKSAFEYEVIDTCWGTPRFLSIEKTGYVLVHENDVKDKAKKK